MADKELRDLFSENLKYWLSQRDKTQADLRRYMGVSSATASDWCNGKKIPRTDKLQIICDWLGLELDDLLKARQDGESVSDSYYLNDDARDLAQFLFDNPEYKILFDASRKVKKEDIEFVKQMMDRMTGNDD